MRSASVWGLVAASHDSARRHLDLAPPTGPHVDRGRRPRLGGATIGGIGTQVTEAQAQATLDAAWDAGLRYFDTAPWYGRGVSELRIGRLLREKPVEEFVISTKVGRILRAPASLPTDRS